MSLVLWVLALAVAGLLIWTRVLWHSAERDVPQLGKLCPVDGGAIHYIEAGPKDAQTLVMIHGLAGVLQNFTYGMFDELAKDFHVIAVDRPGCGYSTRIDPALAGLPEQAAMIGECLDKIGVTDPILVGHSLGGAVSLAMAVERADKTTGLALICPATQPEDEVPEVFKPLAVKSPLMRFIIGHLLSVPMGQFTIKKFLSTVFAPDIPPADFMVKGGAILGFRPSAFIGASEDLIYAVESAALMTARFERELKVPGGILFGADDAILSTDKHGANMQKFGLSYEEINGHGHVLPITAPQDCCDFVRRIAKAVA